VRIDVLWYQARRPRSAVGRRPTIAIAARPEVLIAVPQGEDTFGFSFKPQADQGEGCHFGNTRGP
jgi:hypothetical protein